MTAAFEIREIGDAAFVATIGTSEMPIPEVARRYSSPRRRQWVAVIRRNWSGSTVSTTGAIDQGLDFWQYARDDRFDSGRGWVQAVRQLELGIVHKRIVESRIEQHIVLARKTREHRGKSALVFVSTVGLGPHPAKKHDNPPSFEVA